MARIKSKDDPDYYKRHFMRDNFPFVSHVYNNIYNTKKEALNAGKRWKNKGKLYYIRVRKEKKGWRLWKG